MFALSCRQSKESCSFFPARFPLVVVILIVVVVDIIQCLPTDISYLRATFTTTLTTNRNCNRNLKPTDTRVELTDRTPDYLSIYLSNSSPGCQVSKVPGSGAKQPRSR